mgnify:FL=1
MSVKNKAEDREKYRPIRRKYNHHDRSWIHSGETPGWWVNLFMTHPRRREEARLCRLLNRGSVDGDEVVFPLGNHKPHKDYW